MEVESEYITEEVVEMGRVRLHHILGIELTSEDTLLKLGEPSNNTCLIFKQVHDNWKNFPSITSRLDEQGREVTSMWSASLELGRAITNVRSELTSLRSVNYLKNLALAYSDILVRTIKNETLQYDTIFKEPIEFPPNRRDYLQSWRRFQQDDNAFGYFIRDYDSAACKLINARILLERTKKLSQAMKSDFTDLYADEDASFIDFIESTLADVCEKHSNEASILSKEEIAKIERKAQLFFDSGP